MFITADLFIQVGTWNFSHPTDISAVGPTSNHACATFNPTKTCKDCPFLIDAASERCATTFEDNPDLQASIDAFKLSHPEYFV